jgi:MoaA/NifB/PqqE/SkfB family radical SAM enzyme
MRTDAPYAELAANFVRDLWCMRTGSRRFRPLMTNFYLTKACNLRCRYCYPPGDEPCLPVDETVGLLERIRPHNPALNLTGGEPLMYPGIRDVLRRAHELRFRPLLLSTNGLLLERVEDDLHLVDHVVISLDSTCEPVCDAMFGVPGATPRILRAIRRAGDLASEKGYVLSLHMVLAPETLSGIAGVLDLCEAVGARLSLSPEHGRFDPHPGLPGSPDYRSAINRVLAWKAEGRPVFCSVAYLEAIRDFPDHGCFPLLSPRVEPDGRVYFPCQRIADRHVYLQDYPSLCALMQQEADWSIGPECGRRCYLECYLEVERYLRDPLSALTEAWMLRTMLGTRA